MVIHGFVPVQKETGFGDVFNRPPHPWTISLRRPLLLLQTVSVFLFLDRFAFCWLGSNLFQCGATDVSLVIMIIIILVHPGHFLVPVQRDNFLLEHLLN